MGCWLGFTGRQRCGQSRADAAGISPSGRLCLPPPSTEGGEGEGEAGARWGGRFTRAEAVRTGPRGCKEIPRLRLGMTEYRSSWRAQGAGKRAAARAVKRALAPGSRVEEADAALCVPMPRGVPHNIGAVKRALALLGMTEYCGSWWAQGAGKRAAARAAKGL